MLEKIQETAAFLKGKMHTSPETAIILGTGLGSLANEGSSSAFESSYSYYRYTSGELQHLETLLYLDDGSGGSPWRYSVTTDQYVNSGDFHSVTEDEATAVMDKYTHETLVFTPFVV